MAVHVILQCCKCVRYWIYNSFSLCQSSERWSASLLLKSSSSIKSGYVSQRNTFCEDRFSHLFFIPYVCASTLTIILLRGLLSSSNSWASCHCSHADLGPNPPASTLRGQGWTLCKSTGLAATTETTELYSVTRKYILIFVLGRYIDRIVHSCAIA